jgi:superoxide reductase
MQRRKFFAAALAAAGGMVALSKRAKAASEDEWENVIFTQTDPGHWESVEKLHVPIVTINGRSMTVRTPHPMSEPHYIVGHTVVLGDGKFLSRKTFTWKDEPVSEHTLPVDYKGRITVTSNV